MKNIFVISVLSILTVACGKDVKEDKKDGPDRGYSLLGIENTVWERPCKASEDKTRSAKRILDLKQTSAIYSKIYFTGLDCLEENKRISYVRKHDKIMKEVSSELAGWDTFYFELSTYKATVHRVRLLKFFNQYKRFGFSDWELSKSKEISGLKWDADSEAEGKIGTIKSNTVLLEDDKLYFADYNDRQPIADRTYFYTKRK